MRIKWPGDKKDRYNAIFSIEYGLGGIITGVVFFVIFHLGAFLTGEAWMALNLVAIIAIILSSIICELILMMMVFAIFFGEFTVDSYLDRAEEYHSSGNDEFRLYSAYMGANPNGLNVFLLFLLLLIANIRVGVFHPIFLVCLIIAGFFARGAILDIKEVYLEKDKIPLNRIIQGLALELIMVAMPFAIFMIR